MVQGKPWCSTTTHRLWLIREADRILDFYQDAVVQSGGGFYDLDDEGKPLPTGWPPAPTPGFTLFQTTRMVHCFGLAHLMGRPGSWRIVDHGMETLWSLHRDSRYGGYYWHNSLSGVLDDSKQAYGHAFVLLAAATAKTIGHPDAERLLSDISEVISEKFWERAYGAMAEEFERDWTPRSNYRGQNSNMHLTEGLMGAFEATGDHRYLDMAGEIAELILNHVARSNQWRIVEHFDSSWTVDRDYDGGVFRPYGSLPGHWMEWARLILTLWELRGRHDDWMPDASQALFAKATDEGWDPELGGLYLTVGWDGRPVDRDRYWWPCNEGIGAAAALAQGSSDPAYEYWYRRIWSWCEDHLIDRRQGGWIHQLNPSLEPAVDPWFGKPDIFHALQSCLLPLSPRGEGLAASLSRRGIRLSLEER
jgi:sulfoquinovose isomerase